MPGNSDRHAAEHRPRGKSRRKSESDSVRSAAASSCRVFSKRHSRSPTSLPTTVSTVAHLQAANYGCGIRSTPAAVDPRHTHAVTAACSPQLAPIYLPVQFRFRNHECAAKSSWLSRRSHSSLSISSFSADEIGNQSPYRAVVVTISALSPTRQRTSAYAGDVDIVRPGDAVRGK